MQSIMYVCFTCKKSRRYRAITKRIAPCPHCDAPLVYVFHKFALPKADDRRGWKELRAKVASYNTELASASIARAERMIEVWEAKRAKVDATNVKRLREIDKVLADRRKELAEWREFERNTESIA